MFYLSLYRFSFLLRLSGNECYAFWPKVRPKSNLSILAMFSPNAHKHTDRTANRVQNSVQVSHFQVSTNRICQIMEIWIAFIRFQTYRKVSHSFLELHKYDNRETVKRYENREYKWRVLHLKNHSKEESKQSRVWH